MTENDIARAVVDVAFKVHTTFGPGLLESVYQKALVYELRKRGFTVEPQKEVPVLYDGCSQTLGRGGRLSHPPPAQGFTLGYRISPLRG